MRQRDGDDVDIHVMIDIFHEYEYVLKIIIIIMPNIHLIDARHILSRHVFFFFRFVHVVYITSHIQTHIISQHVYRRHTHTQTKIIVYNSKVYLCAIVTWIEN